MADNNLATAQKDLNLSQEETFLYKTHLKNLNGSGKVLNDNGSISTLYQTSVGVGDKTYNIPTVWGGKILSEDAAFEKAKSVGLNKFPSYGSEKEAEARYSDMHKYMEGDVQNYLKQSASGVKDLGIGSVNVLGTQQ